MFEPADPLVGKLTARFVNLTPHTITIHSGTGMNITVSPSGRIARVVMRETPCVGVASFACISREAGPVEVPDFAEEFGIVSSMVLDAAKAQNHPLLGRLFAPDTGPTATRENGQIVAVTRLVRTVVSG